MVVIILDEIDQLATKDNNVLYKTFSWAQREGSTVVLLGIANGLDLTERVLPMLSGRGHAPQLLNFQPYSKDQLFDIVKHRISGIALADGKPVLDDTAIKLCAAKVTSVSGDLRNCLDICKRTTELAAKSPEKRQLGIMMQVFKDILGSDTSQRMRSLPLHQKITLCAFFRLELQDKDIPAGKLHETYKAICTETRLRGLQQEFYETLNLMACTGFIEFSTKGGKHRHDPNELRGAKVKLRCRADDIKFAFNGDAFISNLLTAKKPPGPAFASKK